MSEIEQQEVKFIGGVGWFFFACIPGVLAGALLMYFAFYTGLIDWQKVQRIEGRMDNRVGVNGELTKPVDLIIKGSSGCFKISRAFLDGGAGKYGGSRVTMYLTNNCTRDVSFFHVYWNSVAPDGTIISSGYENNINGNSEIPRGMTVELPEDIADDSRTVKVVVWAEDRSN